MQRRKATEEHQDGLDIKARVQHNFSFRTTNLVDKSRFSSITNYDFSLQSTKVKFFEEQDVKTGQPTKGVNHTFINLTSTVDSARYRGHMYDANTLQDSLRLASHEQEILSKIPTHPNIICAAGLFRHCGSDYSIFVLPGQPLSAAFMCSDDDVNKVSAALVNAVFHIHNEDIIHNLISPAVLFRSTSGVFRLGYFQLACRDITSVPWLMSQIESHGTRFTAPEILKGCRPTKASDVYSVGKVLCDIFKSKKISPQFKILIDECCSPDFTRRPNIKQLKERFASSIM